MKYELNLIKTTLNGYIIERKNIIKDLRGMTPDDILNELSEKEIQFDGSEIVYMDSLMGSLDDLEKFIKDKSNKNCDKSYQMGKYVGRVKNNFLLETYLTDIVGFYPDNYVGLEILEDTAVLTGTPVQ